ncbi:SpoIIE family protein phosphatase [Streptacidiphilus jiangxiensis]|uniref:protein-serine/threonine phosphatase n=1 Tax=Streptacidiphilus jiangxiensis TaxID=235985 RepID=A0A1H7X4T2_STRJI|nr:SpoIIE family protein phosphatase [Streptacidiphilus jiangxiensis]SEM28836.1 PAS fold-containing protein [Streptacidiphilus jiangxiensis]
MAPRPQPPRLPQPAHRPPQQSQAPDWLEPAMAANGIGSWHWDIRADRIVCDERALAILGLEGRGLRASESLPVCSAPQTSSAAPSVPVTLPSVGAGAPVTLTATLPGGGVPQASITSDEFLALLHPEDAPVVKRRVERAITELGQCGAYYRTVFPSGELHAVRFRGRVLADEQGRPTRMVGFVWDATVELLKRRRADHAATVREERTLFIREAAKALSEAVTTADVARVFTELPLPGIPPDGLVLAVLESGRIQILAASGYDGESRPPHDHVPLDADHPAALALRTRTPVFLASRQEYRQRFPVAWPPVNGHPRHAWAFLPLVASGRPLGVCLVSFDENRTLDYEERTLLSTLGGLVGQSLARARLHDAEHELAAGLQRVLLPRRVPPVPGFEAAARYLPAGTGLQIGGDWYDVVPLPSGHVGVVIGDVQGHDVHAAGVMGQLRIALRAYAAEGHPPAAVMTRASRFLADLDTGHFATCLYAEVNVDYGAVYAVRAGHLNPLIRRADGSTAVQHVDGGLPLGVDPEQGYMVSRFTLDPGDALLLCTDGLVETRRIDLDEGMERLRRVVAGGRDADLSGLADRIARVAADSAERDDDVALLLLRWEGLAASRPREQLRRRIGQADLARIAEVRAELRDAVRRWGVGELSDTVELLASELVTNALVHTDRDAMLTARLTRDAETGQARLRIEVVDDSDQWPKRRTPGEQASSGRGLMLVEALSDAWGVEPNGTGKRMWFELVSETPDDVPERPEPSPT